MSKDLVLLRNPRFTYCLLRKAKPTACQPKCRADWVQAPHFSGRLGSQRWGELASRLSGNDRRVPLRLQPNFPFPLQEQKNPQNYDFIIHSLQCILNICIPKQYSVSWSLPLLALARRTASTMINSWSWNEQNSGAWKVLENTGVDSSVYKAGRTMFAWFLLPRKWWVLFHPTVSDTFLLFALFYKSCIVF